MKNILHITCSSRGADSESTRLSRFIIERLQARDPAAVLVERSLSNDSIAHVDCGYAMSQACDHDVSTAGSMARSEALVRELEQADCVVIGTPMHNLSVPSVLKAWIDHIVRARRTFRITESGKVSMLHDRAVFIAVASGGRFSGERARQADFLTPYLKAILEMVGLKDVTFFSVQGTAAPPDILADARAIAKQAVLAHLDAHDASMPASPNDITEA